jgi:serine/threonine-protein kinase RsbW
MTEEVAGSQIELRVPASKVFVALARTVTASVAAHCDLTLDDIDDLRIAIDEACALLLPISVADATLGVSFRLAADAVEVRAAVDARPGTAPSQDGFAWTVLRALASDLNVIVGPPQPDGSAEVAVTFTKRRDAPGT